MATPQTFDEHEWVLAVHGGAKPVSAADEAANRCGCAVALAAGRHVLELGGSATDAVEASVRVLEDDPTFNAGYGSVTNLQGDVEMCAGIMSGADLAVGAVALVTDLRHPIAAARLLLTEKEILLAGPAATGFARQRGLDPALEGGRPARPADKGHDTVGAVARDRMGHVAAATSTGGLAGKRAGRVGDSPLPGAGYYADDRLGAISLSGEGEVIARLAVAVRVLDRLERRGPDDGLRDVLSEVLDLGGDAGAILVTHDGRFAWAHNSPRFAVGVATSRDPGGQVWLHQDEA